MAEEEVMAEEVTEVGKVVGKEVGKEAEEVEAEEVEEVVAVCTLHSKYYCMERHSNLENANWSLRSVQCHSHCLALPVPIYSKPQKCRLTTPTCPPHRGQ